MGKKIFSGYYKFLRKSKYGFTNFEMAFLLLILFCFLAGLVLIFWNSDAVKKGSSKESHAFTEAEKVVDRIGALIKLSSEVKLGESGEIDIFADLDGNPSSGPYRVGNKSGLERVLIREASKGNLIASVYSNSRIKPEEVLLTNLLDEKEKCALKVEYLKGSKNHEKRIVPPSWEVGGFIKVSVWISFSGESSKYSKTFTLPSDAIVVLSK